MKFAKYAALALMLPGLAFGQTYPNPQIRATGSTTPRGIADRAADVTNALDQGLVCDGATDNGPVFTALSAKTGTIFFPPASQPCLTSVAITPQSNTTWYAYPGSVILKPTASSAAGVLLFAASSGISNVTVYGITFDGGGKDFATGSTVTQAYQATGIVFDHVTIQNTRGIGTLFSSSAKSGVRSSTYTNVGNHWKTTLAAADRQQGISFCCGTTSANVGNFANDNRFDDIGLDAVSIGNATNFTATGNRCELSNNQLTLLATSAYAACVYVTASTGGNVANNYSNSASGNAYDIDTSSNVNVANNYAILSGQAGVAWSSGQGTIIGNTLLNGVLLATSVQQGGISLFGTIANLVVSGNVSTDTQGTKTQAYGFHIASGSTVSNLWVDQSNNFLGNKTASFGGLAKDYNYAQNNGIKLTGGAGQIRILSDSWADGNVVDSAPLVIENNSSSGIALMDGAVDNRWNITWGTVAAGNLKFARIAGTGLFEFNAPIQADASVILAQSTVASLPACNAGLTGAMYEATDLTAPTYNGTLTGGGAVKRPVSCNGTAWVS